MEEIEVSNLTKEEMDTLKEQLYGGQIEDDTFLHLLFSEVLDE